MIYARLCLVDLVTIMIIISLIKLYKLIHAKFFLRKSRELRLIKMN